MAERLAVLVIDDGIRDGLQGFFPDIPVVAPEQLAVGEIDNSGHLLEVYIAHLGEQHRIQVAIQLIDTRRVTPAWWKC